MLEQFHECLKRVNSNLWFLGLSLCSKDKNKTILDLVLSHKLYTVHIITVVLEIVAQVLWIIEAFLTGTRFVEITRLIPCLIFCHLSIFKTGSIIYYAHYNKQFIETMERLLVNIMKIEEEGNLYKKQVIDTEVSMLTNIIKKTFYFIIMGLLMFAFAPVFIIVPHYLKTREVKLEMPFIAYYPFNEFDVWTYPCVYLHQIMAATLCIFMVYGSDCFFFTCCTFLHIQFSLLNHDMERIVNKESQVYDGLKFKKLAVLHIELMRCVNLLEEIFSKSLLINAVTSSVIICVTGFNAMAVDNVVLKASFTSFLTYGLVQIFLFCYYGDTIMRCSMQVGDSLYNSHWYKIEAADRKGILIVMIRAQKPCELTANGFFEINLQAFTSILRNSWSYFALLKTMYHPE